MKFPGRRQTHE